LADWIRFAIGDTATGSVVELYKITAPYGKRIFSVYPSLNAAYILIENSNIYDLCRWTFGATDVT
jgi:hypothetical protein